MDRFIKFLEDNGILNQFINNMEIGVHNGRYAQHMEFIFTRAKDEDKIFGAFPFTQTPEGVDFWGHIATIYLNTLNYENTRK